jgi:hypothetical protein
MSAPKGSRFDPLVLDVLHLEKTTGTTWSTGVFDSWTGVLSEVALWLGGRLVALPALPAASVFRNRGRFGLALVYHVS